MTKTLLPTPRVAWLAVVAALVAALTAACSSGGSSGGSTVNVAYMAGLNSAGPLAVADKQGIWSKVGLNVKASLFNDGPTEVQALESGHVDIAYLGPGAEWEPATGHGVIITVDSINLGDFVIAQPGITSLADLKGKTVGYPKGTSGEMILRESLAKAGLSMDDIKAEPLAPTAVAPAFIAKHIDVAAIWAPISEKIRSQVPGAKFLSGDATFRKQVAATQMWVASASFLHNHPDKVQKFLHGWILANDYRASHPTETVDATFSFTNGANSKSDLAVQNKTTQHLTSKQLYAAYRNGTATKWLTGLQGMLVKMGLQPKIIPPSKFSDWGPFEKAYQKQQKS